jgi:hypothetical protein
VTAPAIRTSPRLETEPIGEVFVFRGPGGGGDLPPPGSPPAVPLARRVRDIFDSTAHGSRSAPVSYLREFPCAHAHGAATATTHHHHDPKGIA